MPSLLQWSLPTAVLLLHLALPTLATPFLPMTGRPTSQLNSRLNLYPAQQDEINDFLLHDTDPAYLDRGFYYPPKRHHHALMKKIHDGFFNEFQRHNDDCFRDDDANSHDNAVQRSSSRNLGGWGKMRAVPATGQAPRIARITPADAQRPYQADLRKRSTDEPAALQPQKVCEFLQLPESCADELTLPPGLLDLPIVAIEIEHSELSWFLTGDNFNTAAAAEAGADVAQQPSRKVLDEQHESEPEPIHAPLFLHIEFPPDAAAALGVDPAAVGLLGVPVAEGAPYRETLFKFHEVETLCFTREVGPYVVCERVYGGGEDEKKDDKKPFLDAPTILVTELE